MHYARIGAAPIRTIWSLLDPQQRASLTRSSDGKV
jgi:hypothetical protein